EPPLILYFLAALELVSRQPLWIAQAMAMMSALGAPFVYVAGSRVGGSIFAGLAGGMFYAVNPAAAVYGRMIPNTALVTLLSAVGLACLVVFWTTHRVWSAALSLMALAWATQLHLAAAPLLVLWLVVAAIRWRSLRPPALAVGAALAVLPLAPY